MSCSSTNGFSSLMEHFTRPCKEIHYLNLIHFSPGIFETLHVQSECAIPYIHRIKTTSSETGGHSFVQLYQDKRVPPHVSTLLTLENGLFFTNAKFYKILPKRPMLSVFHPQVLDH